MSALLHPVGPESAGTYWIRRAAVVAIAVGLIAGLIWLLGPKGDPVAGVPSTTTSPSAPSPDVSPSAATPATSSSTSVSPSPSSTGPTACDPTAVKVNVAGFRNVVIGTKQVLSVGIKNTASAPCVLDLKASAFEVKITSGTDAIWSTASCARLIPEKKTTLKAGAGYEFKVTWNLHRSTADCATDKQDLGAGTYVATGTYQSSASGRYVFVLKKK